MTDAAKIQNLKDFANEILRKMFDLGFTLDEGDIQEIALKYKLLRKERAPKWWAEEYGSDYWYIVVDWLKDKTDNSSYEELK